MILKNVDDKSEIINNLKKLLNHPKIYPSKKKQIDFEIYKIKKGWENEKNAAYYMSTYWKDSEKIVILNDLRLKIDEDVVQIDHLFLHKAFICIFESKFFSSTLYFNQKNNTFSIKTKNGYKGIPNPIKQAERQVFNLKRILEKLNLSKFLPKTYDYYVLVSPNTHLKNNMPEKLIKADMVRQKLLERADNIGMLQGLVSLKDYIKTDVNTLVFVAEELKKLHNPLKFEDYLKSLKLEWLIKTH